MMRQDDSLDIGCGICAGIGDRDNAILLGVLCGMLCYKHW